MTLPSQPIGVAAFVLRRHTTSTEVLLLRRAGGSTAGAWCPVAGSCEDGETQLQTVVRELREETGLEPSRLYATTLWGENHDPEVGAVGRVGIFVAYVEAQAPVALNAEHTEHAWLSPAEAERRLPLAPQREALGAIVRDFIGRPPDEALRVL